jgi:hypothetical protein
MRIHVIQTGTVAIKQVQQHGRTSGNPVVNILRDPTWTEPLPIYAFVIEHPEGLIVVDTGETARMAEPGYFPWWHPYFRFALRAAASLMGCSLQSACPERAVRVWQRFFSLPYPDMEQSHA